MATRGHLSVTPLFKPSLSFSPRPSSQPVPPSGTRLQVPGAPAERGQEAFSLSGHPQRGGGGCLPSPRARPNPPLAIPTHLHTMPVSSTSSLLEGEFLFNVSISSAFLFLRCFRQWLGAGDRCVIIKKQNDAPWRCCSSSLCFHLAEALDGIAHGFQPRSNAPCASQHPQKRTKHPKFNLPQASGCGQDLLPIRGRPFPSCPSPCVCPPPRHVLTAEAGTNDEDDEADDGGDQGDDHDLAPVASQVEDVHPLAASPRVASFAPAPWYRGCRGGVQKSAVVPVPPSSRSQEENGHGVPTTSPLAVAYTQAGAFSATRKRHLPLTQ